MAISMFKKVIYVTKVAKRKKNHIKFEFGLAANPEVSISPRASRYWSTTASITTILNAGKIMSPAPD
jgi:hypothetical protein